MGAQTPYTPEQIKSLREDISAYDCEEWSDTTGHALLDRLALLEQQIVKFQRLMLEYRGKLVALGIDPEEGCND